MRRKFLWQQKAKYRLSAPPSTLRRSGCSVGLFHRGASVPGLRSTGLRSVCGTVAEKRRNRFQTAGNRSHPIVMAGDAKFYRGVLLLFSVSSGRAWVCRFLSSARRFCNRNGIVTCFFRRFHDSTGLPCHGRIHVFFFSG